MEIRRLREAFTMIGTIGLAELIGMIVAALVLLFFVLALGGPLENAARRARWKKFPTVWERFAYWLTTDDPPKRRQTPVARSRNRARKRALAGKDRSIDLVRDRGDQ